MENEDITHDARVYVERTLLDCMEVIAISKANNLGQEFDETRRVFDELKDSLIYRVAKYYSAEDELRNNSEEVRVIRKFDKVVERYVETRRLFDRLKDILSRRLVRANAKAVRVEFESMPRTHIAIAFARATHTPPVDHHPTNPYSTPSKSHQPMISQVKQEIEEIEGTEEIEEQEEIEEIEEQEENVRVEEKDDKEEQEASCGDCRICDSIWSTQVAILGESWRQKDIGRFRKGKFRVTSTYNTNRPTVEIPPEPPPSELYAHAQAWHRAQCQWRGM